MPALQKQRINRWIKEIADGYGKKTGDIAYVFCDDQKILEVNNQYLEHDYYTDIITFDYTTGNTINECAKILVQAGIDRKQIGALTIAKD